MRLFHQAAAYGSGLVPVRDGVPLDVYRVALAFRTWGVPPPDKWVDELIEEASMNSLRGLI